tara:strand:- start:491 stop:886 length:396 start_codon:yes stop_codon:yes gene_type:complete
MAHFAKIGKGNIVQQVVVVANAVLKDKDNNEQESLGVKFLQELYGSRDIWKQTSYNTRGGEHQLGGTPFRKNFASVGYTYDEEKDAFIPPQKYKSWTLDEESCKWKPPVAHPLDGKSYTWNEQTLNWDEVE